jgi:hypothetical protein
VIVATAVAYAGWRWGEPVFPRLERALGRADPAAESVGPTPSPQLAEATLDRFEAFRSGEGERLVLGGAELSSVVRYSLPGIIPPGVEEPTVVLRGGKVLLGARIALAAFPDLPALDEVAGLLPDTVDIQLRGTLLPFDEGHAAFHVERVEASRVPLPSRTIPGILRALGRVHREGLPPDALAVPLPGGLASAYVEEDSLVLVADR